MSMKSLRNKPSRNGFDLSFKKNFTAKCGELLPVMCKEVYPGDQFNIDLSSFTRTMPVNTAAYARMREYYDFYFVPYELLWNKSFTMLSQMNDNPQHAISSDPAKPFTLNGQFPYVTSNNLSFYIYTMNNRYLSSDPLNKHSASNYFGYNRAALSAKLLQYLGYGDFQDLVTDSPASSPTYREHNLQTNVMSLLAYQKIYSDHFRNSQWEKIQPTTFNVDYLTGTDSMEMTILPSDNFVNYSNLLDLRYCDWQKDLYHGLLPNSQMGDVAIAPIANGSIRFDLLQGKSLSDSSGFQQTSSGNGVTTFDQFVIESKKGNPSPQLNYMRVVEGGSSGISILALRQAEMLQKWREISQSANKDFKSQLEKHWNVSVGDAYSELSEYLGGTTSDLSINEVVNTNITGDNSAEIAGKGIGTGSGHISFNSNGRYGVLMCIYHCLPVLDYTTSSVDPMHTKINATDFAIPEFDRIGMQSVPVLNLINRPSSSGNLPISQLMLGYAPRYIDLKTSIDQSVGAFRSSLSHWIINYDDDSASNYLYNNDDQAPTPNVVNSFVFNKVDPNCVDPIFVQNVDSTVDTDNFLCSAFFDVKAVRNFDTDGLPY